MCKKSRIMRRDASSPKARKIGTRARADVTIRSSRSSAAPKLAHGRGISRGALHETVAKRLLDMIVVGRLPAGEVIRELEVCKELGISRTPMREALKVLAADDIVALLPGRGAVVVAPSADDVKGALYAVGAIEGACAPLACANITAGELAAIRDLHGRMVRHHRRNERLKYFRTNLRIHEKIVAASRNAFLIGLHRKLVLKVRRIRFLGNAQLSWWDQAIREHEQMLGCLKARDGEALARILRMHMIVTWDDIKHTIDSGASAAPLADGSPHRPARPKRRRRG